MGERGREPGTGEGLAGQVELLGAMKVLRHQVRAARHGYWFPLALFGVLTCASIPFYVRPAPVAGPGGVTIVSAATSWPLLGGDPVLAGSGGLAFYWMAALLGGLLPQLWYWWHAQRVGVATRARAYFVTMAALTVNIVARLGWSLPPADQSVPNVLLPALVLAAGAAAAFAVRQHRSAA